MTYRGRLIITDSTGRRVRSNIVKMDEATLNAVGEVARNFKEANYIQIPVGKATAFFQPCHIVSLESTMKVYKGNIWTRMWALAVGRGKE